MNLNQLRVFHAVARLQSFTRASTELCITQPGVSKHIQALESHYGIRLFDRLGKTVALTPAGETLSAATTSIFRSLEAAKAKIDDIKGVTGGKLNVGASFTIGTYLIPEILSRFHQLYPEVEITLEIAMSRHIAQKVVSNDLDIGFLGAPAGDDRLVLQKMMTDELTLVVAREHPWNRRESVNADELRRQPFLLPGPGSGTRSTIEAHLEQAGIRLANTIEFGNIEAVKKAVAAGMGVSLLSKLAVMGEIGSGALKSPKLSGIRPFRSLYFARHKDKFLSTTLRVLIEMLATIHFPDMGSSDPLSG
ncbi:MAG: LysR family transcriptional regulator [Desulfosarcinaceae bacterium]|nr:LysR family transcriptional regulator [Desulfosarcinaceae bacterium]